MKKLLWLLILISGCSQSPDPKIKEIEKQIVELRQRQADLEEQTRATMNAAASRASETTNEVAMVKTFIFKELANEQVSIDNLSNSLASVGLIGPYTRVQTQMMPAHTQAVVAQTGFKNGVPVSVYNQIAADARREWPTNYEMQNYEIDKQITAWKNLQSR